MIAEAAAIFDYEAQPRTYPPVCNLCGAVYTVEPEDLTDDRYGFAVGAPRCACGLVFLAPRMTAEAYRQFYETGAYRRLVSAYHGREINAQTIRAEQREYAKELADFLMPHIQRLGVKHPTVLDVGGSTGVVADKMRRRFRAVPTVLDPAVDELAYAECERIVGTAEEFEPCARKWDVILLCQTIDHLLDPMGVLKKLRGCLSDNGLLFVDIVDYDVTKTIKIDHPFNFTPATMAEMLKRAGFREVARERAADGVHVRFLCGR